MTNPKPLPYANKGNLVEGPVGKHLLRLAAPMTWGIMMTISYQLANVFFISKLGDTKLLAAASFTFPLTYLLFSFLMGFGIATASSVSRLVGAGEHENVLRVTSHSLLFSVFIGAVLAAFGIALGAPLFRLMGAQDDLLGLVQDYMRIWFLGLPFIAAPLVANASLRADGDAFSPAIIMTGAAILNVLLDIILIFGFLGFPRLALEGAAIAGLVSNFIAAAASFGVLYWKRKLFSFRAAFVHAREFGDSLKRILFIALPAGITNSIAPFVNAFILALLARHGEEAVAAFGVVSRIEAFAFVVLMGLAVGMAPIVGQNWGARRYDRVNETLQMAMQFNILWSLAVALVLGVCAMPIARAFSEDPNVAHYAAHYFWMVPFSYAFGNLVNGWASAFNAMGQPQRAFLMIVFRMLILMIPAAYIGETLGGPIGVFVSIAAVNVASGAFFHWQSWRFCRAREREAALPQAA